MQLKLSRFRHRFANAVTNERPPGVSPARVGSQVRSHSGVFLGRMEHWLPWVSTLVPQTGLQGPVRAVSGGTGGCRGALCGHNRAPGDTHLALGAERPVAQAARSARYLILSGRTPEPRSLRPFPRLPQAQTRHSGNTILVCFVVVAPKYPQPSADLACDGRHSRPWTMSRNLRWTPFLGYP
jgi:hypothetical protein